MKIVGIIPARFKSKRFPGKMLHLINGKTLIQHTFENVSAILPDLFVATDDEKIATQAENFGAKVLKTSESCQNGTERIIEALVNYPILKTYDVIINIQGDHPCIKKETICAVIDALKEADVATAVSPISRMEAESPSVVKCVFDQHFKALYFSRAPIPYNGPFYYHVGIYAYKAQFLEILKNLKSSPLQLSEDLEQLKILEGGFDMRVAITDEEELGVDLIDDVKKVEKHLCR